MSPTAEVTTEKERLYLESCAVWNVDQTKIVSDEQACSHRRLRWPGAG